MSNLLLGLEYEAQLPPVVRYELEQLIAGLQTYNAQQGIWTAVPYDKANFSSPGVNWTVEQGDVITFAFSLTGKTMTVAWYLSVTTIAVAVNLVRLRIPTGALATRQIYNMFAYSDNGTRNFGYAFSDVGSPYITLSKLDGSSFGVSGNNTAVWGQIIFEIA